MDSVLIAPCGMNCALCLAYHRKKNHCAGCRIDDPGKFKSRSKCIILNCEKRQNSDVDFCYVCNSFPCRRLKDLDKRYRTKYGMSMLDNLEYIKINGVEAFTENESKRWKCDNCGEIICVHRGCLNCSDKKCCSDKK